MRRGGGYGHFILLLGHRIAGDALMKSKSAVAARVAEIVAELGNGGSEEATLAALMFEDAVAEDLRPYSTEELAGLARSALGFLKERKPGRAKVRVVEPEVHIGRGAVTVIEMANDDMPFIVDSSLALLTERGYEILLVLHPIVSVRRIATGALEAISPERREGDGFIRESFVHIHLGKLGQEAESQEVHRELLGVLGDVRTAVLDWRPMQSRLQRAMAEYQKNPPPLPVEELIESSAFLEWLLDNHFTFLGMREYEFVGGAGEGELKPIEGSGLGILRNPDAHVLRRGTTMVSMTPEIRAFLLQPVPLIITKSDAHATVHRRAAMDYIGVKQFDPQGELVGELRMVGLFTSTAYTRSPRDVPLIRRKIANVLANSGFSPTSHSGKGLLHVLENFPREELFQVDAETLGDMARGILRLEERPRIRLFERHDKFDRFVSAFVFLPRDRYSTEVRIKVGDCLAEAFGGEVSGFAPSFGETTLVRVHYTISRHEGARPEPDLARLEGEIAEIVRIWDERLGEAIAASFAPDQAIRLDRAYRGAFSLAYQYRFQPATAIDDIRQIETLVDGTTVAVEFYTSPDDEAHQCRLKLYRRDEAIPLSGRLPILEHMGLRAIEESTYMATPAEDGASGLVFIHNVLLESADCARIDTRSDGAALAACFLAVWADAAENDDFNGLVLKARLHWREAALLRACGKYLRQAGIAFSLDYIALTLVKHPDIARKLVELFDARFNPVHWVVDGVPLAKADRKPKERAIVKDIVEALGSVASLDEDRIIRRVLNLIRSTLRTNYYQPTPSGGHPPCLAFKIESPSIEDLPEPRPYAEIFVYAPDVEGVHLRGGKIARGGLRWSDRPEDFRTEVLGLQKAQSVKNSVIVPVGAKGGFVAKRLPFGGSRDEIVAEGVRTYRLFISALLDLTDNIVEGQVVPPRDVIRHDGPDPYLVVAADKGTATFSDIANAISEERGFWLGDAFASGGSAGYDHKKKGITARGAWEAVKRHFWEMDIDIQTTPFTVIGIGDMSGDVFGNGMLLSTQIRLLAAFDHRDIFIDPDPDPATSFAERQRLFELPRSSWQDYDKAKISRGGGVFSRQLKAIPLSAEMQAMTGLKRKTATPNELMSALLKLNVGLIWFGGIGTYVRASNETNAEVGDRANDAIRVTAAELKAKVIGEGANLAITQRGRIEFALMGGHVNTDAVDNSAGVNSSDLEVNIKIAFSPAEARGELDRAQRNKLLGKMTDEVAALVLRNNHLQTLCLTLGVARGDEELGYDDRLMRDLEARGLLDRRLESLPDEATLAEYAAKGRGLSRPELAVLMAYSKIVLFDQLLDSPVPDDPYLGKELFRYFPERMAKQFPDEIADHKLRREIIATMLANSMINRGGPSFVSRLMEETGHSVADIASAYAMARDSFDFVSLNASVDALGGRIAGQVQIDMYLELQLVMRRATIWYLRNCSFAQGIEPLVAHYVKGVKRLEKALPTILPESNLERVRDRLQAFLKAGVPDDVAQVFAGLRYLQRAPDVIMVAGESRQPIEAVARVLFHSGIDLRVDRLIGQSGQIQAGDFYERLAINRTVDGIIQTHRAIVSRAMARRRGDSDGWSRWRSDNEIAVERARRIVDELLAERGLGLPKLTVAASQLAELVTTT
jgi:glutamate dehydrogenase